MTSILRDAVSNTQAFKKVHEPDMKAFELYSRMLPVYAALEKRVLEKCSNS